MPTDYVEDYEEVTGLQREPEVKTKVIKPPKQDTAEASSAKVETA